MKTLWSGKHISGVEEYAIEGNGCIEFRVKKDGRKNIDPDFCSVHHCRNKTDTMDRGIPICEFHLKKEYERREEIEKKLWQENKIPKYVPTVLERIATTTIEHTDNPFGEDDQEELVVENDQELAGEPEATETEEKDDMTDDGPDESPF